MTTINDKNGSNPVYSQTYWLDDAYGNVLQSKIWDYTPNVLNFRTTAAPARTYTNTYASSTAYTNAYILNLLATSSVQDSAGNTATLATNTYDSYTGGIGSPASGAMEHDGAYGTNFTARGNLTTSVSPGKTVNIAYDLTGTPTGSDDGYKHAVSLTTSSSTNYSAPATVQPNTSSSNDANLSTTLSYSPFLGISQVIGANSMQTSAQYDSLGRLSQSTAATDAVTTMAYYFGAAIPPVPAQNLLHRSRQVVESKLLEHTAEVRKSLFVCFQKRLLRGAKVGPVKRSATRHASHRKYLQRSLLAADHGVGLIPVHLSFHSPRITLRHEGLSLAPAQLHFPLTDVAAYG